MELAYILVLETRSYEFKSRLSDHKVYSIVMIKRRKQRPQPPKYFNLDTDNCYFCKNKSNCSGCKILKAYNSIKNRSKKN